MEYQGSEWINTGLAELSLLLGSEMLKVPSE